MPDTGLTLVMARQGKLAKLTECSLTWADRMHCTPGCMHTTYNCSSILVQMCTYRCKHTRVHYNAHYCYYPSGVTTLSHRHSVVGPRMSKLNSVQERLQCVWLINASLRNDCQLLHALKRIHMDYYYQRTANTQLLG